MRIFLVFVVMQRWLKREISGGVEVRGREGDRGGERLKCWSWKWWCGRECVLIGVISWNNVFPCWAMWSVYCVGMNRRN